MSTHTKTVILVLSLIVAVYLFSVVVEPSAGNNRCDIMTTIAQNAEKVGYLEDWMDTKLKDMKFLELMGWIGDVNFMDHPELQSQIGIDWEFLGMLPGYASVTLNRAHKDRDNYLDASNIKSVSFGQGRSSIIIKTNGSEELGLEWPSDLKKRIRTINDRVSFFCDD